MKKIFFLLLCFFSLCELNAQEYTAENVKTARIRILGADFSYPICKLGEVLELQFDVLNDEYSSLVYSIRHCDCNFQVDDLEFYEFASGFDFSTINDYDNSFNTHQSFTHYSIKIPNEDLQLLISGNYVINIYDDSDRETPILTKYFMISEMFDNSKLEISVSRPFLSEYSFDNQQVGITIKGETAKISNPQKYLKVFAMQNKDFSTRQELEISNFSFNELSLKKNTGNNLFLAGSEYMFLDAKDVHFRALGIDKITFENNLYTYYLSPVKPVDVSYSFQEDLNGDYYIKNDKGFSMDLEADYIKVKFRLQYDRFSQNKIFLKGKAFEGLSEMVFNPENNYWEKDVILKQGLYNFQFVEFDEKTRKEKVLTGNWYNTENDYFISVYTKFLKDRGDRLIMYKTINTVK